MNSSFLGWCAVLSDTCLESESVYSVLAVRQTQFRCIFVINELYVLVALKTRLGKLTLSV